MEVLKIRVRQDDEQLPCCIVVEPFLGSYALHKDPKSGAILSVCQSVTLRTR